MADPPHAEVIGDPIAHSLSPLIYNHWLAKVGLPGTYSATLVPAAGLPAYLDERRRAPGWRGCNVTAPHKQDVLPLLDRLDPAAARIGAVNCVTRDGPALVGHNTDVEGIAAALGTLSLTGRRVVLIGAGGGARAALHELARRSPAEVVILSRRPDRQLTSTLPPGSRTRLVPIEEAEATLRGAALVVNATPLGMSHAAPVPAALMQALAGAAADAAVFDMVYQPRDTPLLRAAAAAGLRTIDGLEMLVGQARRSFALLFGAAPPPGDTGLRRLLAGPPLASAPTRP